MRSINRGLILLFLAVLIIAGCSFPSGSSASTSDGGEILPVTTESASVLEEIIDLNGTWTGTMLDGDFTREVTLVINQAPSAAAFDGQITISSGEIFEEYLISGTIDAGVVHFSESQGRCFTATVSGEAMSGYFAWDCFDCPDNASVTFTVSRTAGTVQLPDEQPMTSAGDLNGRWTGGLNMLSDGKYYDAIVEIIQEFGSAEFTGTIQFIDPTDAIYNEFYMFSGTQDGTNIQFHDTGTEVITHYFWGFIEGDALTFFISLNCYQCGDVYGQVNVYR